LTDLDDLADLHEKDLFVLNTYFGVEFLLEKFVGLKNDNG
jgi:hypothetical protein